MQICKFVRVLHDRITQVRGKGKVTADHDRTKSEADQHVYRGQPVLRIGAYPEKDSDHKKNDRDRALDAFLSLYCILTALFLKYLLFQNILFLRHTL